ncbi:MAG: hypothetical protein GFH27_549321n121 [Chloroflexi bacterium AL-W]|nr:hypothetical protein [Chloroflexi bacterium AL-N1]NOK64999.1 hypothetical protein [Chloroflexi bacterium AL-N10]NOK76769.1 hypothetical protein [Chloroflexi bacterium AL-N5]NOK84660.1 hypothetical protein [Chloroflexi bacterium AL-W]NOK86515.1 hypothetical protein [Chloroflexi bacterium AL-N15]
MPPRKSATSSTPVQAPQIKWDVLEDAGESATLTNNSLFERVQLQHADMSAQTVDDVLFEQVVCKHINFGQSTITLGQLIDCQFHTCDFANTTLEKCYVRRVEFSGCRMLGINLPQLDGQDVVWRDCNVEWGRFEDAALKSTRFERCLLREASFGNSDLSGAVLYNCDLTRADFRGAKLAGTDLRGSTIDGIQISPYELQEVIVDSAQALQLVSIFGLVVKDSDG